MSSDMLQTWQHLTVFLLESSEIYRSSGSIILIVKCASLFAVGYFFRKTNSFHDLDSHIDDGRLSYLQLYDLI
jgi:type II secretory pathway component PulF